ncbi:aminotransferase-like domain-containing protein [Oceanirhabdus sp. W0125-5]|uniref:aminotransferase-like domain-containing protein n=1 Tax=Oceanirhabdus sp. W0125-5 TaxID=2999116 RepID=UPI0022F326E6|nr:PLP-dependent aminotransferase family protein [Oceanirhabdus sp. W0125-5]WBW99649.1 PLP-dependent aminotransferase family protein [Oceanirhabdus sp. W0125-5]
MFFIQFNENKKKYIQLADYIKNMIENGSLTYGGKLPSTRELSEELKIGRSTVMKSYELLEMEEYIYTIKGKGTFINQLKIKRDNEKKSPQSVSINWESSINNYAKRAVDLDIMKWDAQYKKGMISFKSIAPDGDTFDIEGFKRAFYNRLSIEGSNLLNYGYAKGYKPLTEWLLEYIKDKGVNIEGKDILITNGFTEGLNLALSAICESGDKVICENPTHNTAIKIMKMRDIQIIGVDIKSREGIDTNELKKIINNNDVKAVFLIPSYHNPTGLVMSYEKREEIYSILSEKNIPIIEDWFAEELNYSGDHIKSITAIGGSNNNVINIGSFSKILFPGMRIGWIFADKELIDVLESIKRAMNIHTSFIDQGILYEYLKSEQFPQFIKRIRRRYKQKYELMKEMVEEEIKYEYLWGDGGLYMYVILNEKIKVRTLLERCIKRGVIFTCGDVFSVSNIQSNGISSNKVKIENGLRLGFSKLKNSEIKKGIKIIGEEIEEMLNNNSQKDSLK